MCFVRDDTAPERAVLYSDSGHLLNEPLLHVNMRSGQAADAFDAASKSFHAHLERLGRPQTKIPTVTEALGIAAAYNEEARRCEAAGIAEIVEAASTAMPTASLADAGAEEPGPVLGPRLRTNACSPTVSLKKSTFNKCKIKFKNY